MAIFWIAIVLLELLVTVTGEKLALLPVAKGNTERVGRQTQISRLNSRRVQTYGFGSPGP